ncbi:trichohyalin-like isoform X3 [Megalobrama amblycephala]|uniref:trichohyalin-like isoform X3 n=1 Tax=Megalobrama amblycephala TaxID=75352 RepID=UPI0020144C34|nr:trichohyalin-like isoform X3 [Megalobrama amblycephala]
MREMESARAEKNTVLTELENERSCRLHLRSRFVQQQWRLREALALLQSSRGEMTTVKSQLTHFLETWDNSKAPIQQSCISADAGLRDEVKTLKIGLQKSMHQKEHVKKLLEIKSVEKEDLQALWSEQTAAIERLSQDLREKEESRLSCQQRCESMQEQLLAWQQKEEEVTQRLERAEGEMKDLRVARSTLQQERLSFHREELRRTHVGELERLEESFRRRLNAAEEHSSKMEVLLQQKQAEQDKQLKQQEMELRREAEIELDIQRQKNQELQNKYQSENQQLQNKIPALIHSATQELREELAELQKRVNKQEEEMQHIRKSASQRQQQLLQEQRTGEAQLQSALQELQQKTQELNQAQSHIHKLREERAALEEEKCFLEETVRRECEEREELTAALTLAKEQLKHTTQNPQDTHTHTRLSRSTLMNSDLPVPRLNPSLSLPQTRNHGTSSSQSSRQRLSEWRPASVGRSTASWHGSSMPAPTLPKISKGRVASVNNLSKSIVTVRSRQDKL